MKPGPKPRGNHAMTPAERTAAFRARRKAGHCRRYSPELAQQAAEAVAGHGGDADGPVGRLPGLRDTRSGGLTDSAIADRLEEALLRDFLDRLAVAECRNFRRDRPATLP